MRLLPLYISLFIYFSATHAQEKTIILSDSMFNATGGLDFSDLDGWVFHPDCGENLAPKDVNTTVWKSLKPSQLSTDHINDSGRACGWFRIKVRLDSSFASKPIGFMNRSWMATDLYINGKHVQSFGSTGYMEKAFGYNTRFKAVPLLINLQADSTYTIALRVSDQRPVSPADLASSSLSKQGRRLLFLSNSLYTDYAFNFQTTSVFHDGLTTAVTSILSLLFWMIYLLNPSEKNIKRFAIGVTSLAIVSISIYIKERGYMTFPSFAVFQILAISGIIFFVCYIPFILAGVFNRAVPRWVSASLVVLFIFNFGLLYFDQMILFIAASLLPIACSLYYLFSDIRHLSRAQFCIVIGFSISVFFVIVFLMTSSEDYLAAAKYYLIYTVASPLGMLGYVAFRFREMIVDVQTSADRILALSEEKRIEAERQQVTLEEEVAKQTLDLKSALVHLQDTQKQLIQSEKMASLGELTAGIAHEIQNPLNFVKNFSEVSVELLEDMIVELKEGNTDEAQYIAGDVSQNLEKIVHHGNRADNIVKGMLQHSRSGTGTKEPTAINAFVDEYVRLGHHGLRAKDKIVNVDVKTDYDQSIDKLGIMQQEMGRVILNLITNAFYAVTDKKKTADEHFVPVVSVSTSRDAHCIRIAVKDNGNGIPLEIKEKIFQPFFTTKPTGEGTGLGLSLAYDIVKAHNGELTVETSQGEGTTFTIILPV